MIDGVRPPAPGLPGDDRPNAMGGGRARRAMAHRQLHARVRRMAGRQLRGGADRDADHRRDPVRPAARGALVQQAKGMADTILGDFRVFVANADDYSTWPVARRIAAEVRRRRCDSLQETEGVRRPGGIPALLACSI